MDNDHLHDQQPQTDSEHPFAGREQAFARLQYHLNAPTTTPPVVFLGRDKVGKTMLLRQFQALASPETIGVYVALKHTPLDNEPVWLHALAQTIAETTAQRGYSSSSIKPLPDEPDSIRDWFSHYLPGLFRVIRPNRQFALLLDDAEYLLNAVQRGHLPPDSFAYLYGLLHPQLGIALTIHVQYESRLNQLSPLVNPGAVQRLTNLSLEAVTQILHTSGESDYDHQSVQTIYKLTGGEPAVVQQYRGVLQKLGKEPISDNDFKAVTHAVYSSLISYFETVWKNLSQDERLVLTALSSLLYDNPLRPIDNQIIETWLVDTDYPIDMTAINAAIRSLEYREVLDGTAPDLRVTSGLMQKWLIENARMDVPPRPVEIQSEQSQLRWILMGIAILVLIGILAIVSLRNTSNPVSEARSEPTITLAPSSQ